MFPVPGHFLNNRGLQTTMTALTEPTPTLESYIFLPAKAWHSIARNRQTDIMYCSKHVELLLPWSRRRHTVTWPAAISRYSAQEALLRVAPPWTARNWG